MNDISGGSGGRLRSPRLNPIPRSRSRPGSLTPTAARRPSRPTRPSRLSAVLLLPATLLALALSHAGAQPVEAADGADVRASTTYTLVPEARVVRVSAEVTLRNVKPDTAGVRYYFSGYGLGIHREATSLRVTRAGKPLRASVTARRGFRVVEVSFGTRVFQGQSVRFRLEYDLRDGGARSRSLIRVGRAFAGFYAYAYGEERGEVRIVLPRGFRVSAQEGDRLVTSRGRGGTTVLSATGIRRPDRWWAYVAADRPGALRVETFVVSVGGDRQRVTLKAWPEDAVWARAVRARLEGGLPIMTQLIGLPWPVTTTLEVSEVFSPLLGGYAGIYYQGKDQIRITEDPDEHVVLHEASHAWFNSGLFRGRWINEGLADEYAARTLARLGSAGYAPDPADRDDRAAFPLNEWPMPRAANDDVTQAREKYGYNTSWTVIRQLVAEVGEEGMRRVLRAAEEREVPYVGDSDPEQLSAPGGADWRNFLDLLEERGGSQQATALFREWVVGARDRGLLEERARTRRAYAALLERGRGWMPGWAVRFELASWRFKEATRNIELASAVLQRRDRIEQLARSLGITTTRAVEDAYEGTTGDFARARRLADEQLSALEGIDRARDRLGAERDPVTIIGLLGADADASLAEARRDFERDDLAGSREAATRAERLAEGARARGTERAAVAAGVGAGGLLVVGVGGAAVLRRRRRSQPSGAPGAEPRSAGSPPDGIPAALPGNPAREEDLAR